MKSAKKLFPENVEGALDTAFTAGHEAAARWRKHSPRRDAALPWLPMTHASGCAH